MPVAENLTVKSLSLDLKNFRTIPQSDELHAVRALISVDIDGFWALMESLLTDGYHLTENILVLKERKKLVVKEGNRRIAALKLALGYIREIDIPDNLIKKIDELPADWRNINGSVPCAVFEANEQDEVLKYVALTHAKGEKAGRLDWNAIARARFARDQKGASEPNLDLLECYLMNSRNISAEQAERWAGDYPLTVLTEAVTKIASRLELASSKEFIRHYPKKYKKALDCIMHEVGTGMLTFSVLRNQDSLTRFLEQNAILVTVDTKTNGSGGSEGGAKPDEKGGAGEGSKKSGKRGGGFSTQDPRAVTAWLRDFSKKKNLNKKTKSLVLEAASLKWTPDPGQWLKWISLSREPSTRRSDYAA